MELFKLENLRDEIQDRIKHLEEFLDGAWDYSKKNPHSYIGGERDAKIQEVIFLQRHLNFILKEVAKAFTKVAKALGLERVYCDCEECKPKKYIVSGAAVKLEADIAEIEKKDDSGSDMKQKLDEALSKVKDILIEFHVPRSKYWSEVHEIVEDCYRLQDEIREDLKEKKENKKYTVISFIKEGPRLDGGLDSLEAAREHANRMLNVSFKVEIREAGSNKLVANMAPTGAPKITMHECMWGKEE